MKTVLDDAFAYAVLAIVEEIPAGRVATYGQIARLMGRENHARLVARVLAHAHQYGQFPCHRVVNYAGRLAPGWSEQAELLAAEGVVCKHKGYVDLKHYLWSSGGEIG